MRCPHASALVAVAALALPAAGQMSFFDESFDYDHDHPAVGHWLGNLQPGRFPDTWSELSIDRDESGQWTATVTILLAMALGTPCADVEIDGRSVAFTVPIQGGPRFAGEISADGQRLAGAIVFAEAAADAPGPGAFEFARTPRPVDLPEALAYSGTIQAQGMPPIGMIFVFAETPAGNWVGHVDVPAQGLLDFPLINVKRDGDAISAELAVVPFPASLQATFDEGGHQLTGSFTQGPYDLAVDFTLDEAYAGPKFIRPQHPEPPFPYRVVDVTIAHPDGHALAGTLTVPPGPGPFPGAVLVSGSGPQDRDETIFGHRPFLVIADHLTRHGIAVLRFDDRGTNQSTGSFAGATSQDLATDARAALEFLKTVEGIDASRSGFIGHSEGGIIAPMVAATTDGVAFIVLLAGTGVPGDDVLRVQGKLILEAAGADEATIANTRELQEKFFALLRAGADDEELRDVLRPMIRTELETALAMEGEQLDQMVEIQLRQQASPWMRYFVTYDPRPALTRVRCPVLALNGTLDLQVWHEQNLPEIAKAVTAGGGDVTVRRYEGLNHLFQPATTGSIMEYGVIETTFDEAVLRDMVEWIKLKTGS